MSRIQCTAVSAAATAALTAALWVPFTGAAGAATVTKCTGSVPVMVLDPGLEVAKQASGKFHNDGTGTVECDGPVLGRTPTGPGVLVEDAGTFTGDCAKGGTGTFEHIYRFPTGSGPVELRDTGTFAFGALKGGAFGGEFSGAKADGSFSVLPKQGNCVTSAITAMSVDQKINLKP